jgi:5-hydroxyisourate hydrolase
MSQITTHILDIARGAPASKVPITLSRWEANSWHIIGSGVTDNDGRISNLCESKMILDAGTYQMHFDTAVYFNAMSDPVFYPWADVAFNIDDSGQHYHIPLLLSPFGHSTYRGS